MMSKDEFIKASSLENYAQLQRFVVRKTMKREEAIKVAISNAVALAGAIEWPNDKGAKLADELFASFAGE